MSTFYKKLYTDHIANSENPNQGVGGMDEKFVSDFQLQILIGAGLKSSDKVYEVGAGTGRLLESLIPFLLSSSNSSYYGIEIVQECVNIANERISKINNSYDQRFNVVQVRDDETPEPPDKTSPDFICAFSVFTHMEAEDIVLKLIELRKISHTNTIGVFTFLPLEHVFGRSCFEFEMALDPETRLSKVRNVAFTRDMAIQLAEIAGWALIDDYWSELNEPYENGVPRTNQSWLVLKPNYNFVK